jgi:purine-binding chemotaxis protein CheW
VAERFVSFLLGGEGYCVPLDSVLEILRQESVVPAPVSAADIVGVISLRGDVIPVVDLRGRLGLTSQRRAAKRRVLVVQSSKRSYGLLVDEVKEIVDNPLNVLDLSALFSAGA